MAGSRRRTRLELGVRNSSRSRSIEHLLKVQVQKDSIKSSMLVDHRLSGRQKRGSAKGAANLLVELDQTESNPNPACRLHACTRWASVETVHAMRWRVHGVIWTWPWPS